MRLATDDHVLLLTMHHIVSDGWSMGVLVARAARALRAPSRAARPIRSPALPVQYADYAAWQRQLAGGRGAGGAGGVLARTLAGAPDAAGAADRPAAPGAAGPRRRRRLRVELDEALTAALKALAQRHGATLFMTLLAGWAAAARAGCRGQDDVVVGTPIANRERRRDRGADRLLRQHAGAAHGPVGRARRRELLARVQERGAGGAAHQDVPFEQVVERAAAGAQPGAQPALPGDVRLAERAGRRRWSCRGWRLRPRWTPAAGDARSST